MVRPMGVITTVGFTAFTRICKEVSQVNNVGGALGIRTAQRSCSSLAHLVGPKL